MIKGSRALPILAIYCAITVVINAVTALARLCSAQDLKGTVCALLNLDKLRYRLVRSGHQSQVTNAGVHSGPRRD